MLIVEIVLVLIGLWLDLYVQVLFDCVYFFFGQIDGLFGFNQKCVVFGFQVVYDLKVIGELDDVMWQVLQVDCVDVLVCYILIVEDVVGFFQLVLDILVVQVKLKVLGFVFVEEVFGECFYVDLVLLCMFNFGVDFSKVGMVIQVLNIVLFILFKVVRLVIDKFELMLCLFDVQGMVYVQFLVLLGSWYDLLLIGIWKIFGILCDLIFYYNFKLFWDVCKGEGKVILLLGLNNLVGCVWIDFFKLYYGLYGMFELGYVGKIELYGCVCMINWDVLQVVDVVDVLVLVVMQEQMMKIGLLLVVGLVIGVFGVWVLVLLVVLWVLILFVEVVYFVFVLVVVVVMVFVVVLLIVFVVFVVFVLVVFVLVVFIFVGSLLLLVQGIVVI